MANIKSDSSIKPVTSFSETAIWTMYPNTIKLLQQQRGPSDTAIERRDSYLRNRGINATIVLLSALSIEGFLVECLHSFTMGSKAGPHRDFQSRLNYDFHVRVSSATFKDFPELFRITLGKPLSELIDDFYLIDGVRRLIDFRNGLAHARSVVYVTRDFEFTTVHRAADSVPDYEIDQQYKNVHAYLEENDLVFSDGDLFQNDIADHFANLVKPYMDAVVRALPVPQSDHVQALVAAAHRGGVK